MLLLTLFSFPRQFTPAEAAWLVQGYRFPSFNIKLLWDGLVDATGGMAGTRGKPMMGLCKPDDPGMTSEDVSNGWDGHCSAPGQEQHISIL